jgi:hypothetical protein
MLFNHKLDLTNLYSGGVFLLCNGPSRNNYDLSLLGQVMTMTINNGGHSFRSDMWIGEDNPKKFMDSIWQDPKIMKFTSENHRALNYWDSKNRIEKPISKCPAVFFHEKEDTTLNGWLDGNAVHWKTPIECGDTVKTTMLAAIHILYILGFRIIYLLGADFEMSPEKKYCFEQDRSAQSIKHNNRIFKATREFFRLTRPIFLDHGLTVYNCGVESKLDTLPYRDYLKSVNENLIYMGGKTLGMYEGKYA